MIRYQLFAARDGDTVDEQFEIEASGSDLLDGEIAESRAFAIVCKAFRLDESDYADWNELNADLDGSTLNSIGLVEADGNAARIDVLATVAMEEPSVDDFHKLAGNAARTAEHFLPAEPYTATIYRVEEAKALLAAVSRTHRDLSTVDMLLVAARIAERACLDDPAPAGPVAADPVPVDLIMASRDLIAAFGGDVPDWLDAEIGALELALKPFAHVDTTTPVEGFGEGDTMPIRRLEKRDGAVLHVLCSAFWNVIADALGLDDLDEGEGERIVNNMLGKHIGGLDDLSALLTVTRDGVIEELWAASRYPDSEGVPFTCVWIKGELAK